MQHYVPEHNWVEEEDPGTRRNRRRRRWGRRLTAVLECLAMADPMTVSMYLQAKEQHGRKP